MSLPVKNLAIQAGAIENAQSELVFPDTISLQRFSQLLGAVAHTELSHLLDNIPVSEMSDWQLGRQRGVRKCLEVLDTKFMRSLAEVSDTGQVCTESDQT
jgi:hypothetical protein